MAHWWCSTCNQAVLGCNVTYEEYHDNCGTPVKWIEGEELSKCEQLEQENTQLKSELYAVRELLSEVEEINQFCAICGKWEGHKEGCVLKAEIDKLEAKK